MLITDPTVNSKGGKHTRITLVDGRICQDGNMSQSMRREKLCPAQRKQKLPLSAEIVIRCLGSKRQLRLACTEFMLHIMYLTS